MSETWEDYARVTENGGYLIHDEEDIHKHFTQIPNLVIDMDLSLSAFKLYAFFKKVCGETQICWRSGKTIAKESRLSKNTLTKAKKELVAQGLITIIEKQHPQNGYTYHEVAMKRIWVRNNNHYEGTLSQKMG